MLARRVPGVHLPDALRALRAGRGHLRGTPPTGPRAAKVPPPPFGRGVLDEATEDCGGLAQTAAEGPSQPAALVPPSSVARLFGDLYWRLVRLEAAARSSRYSRGGGRRRRGPRSRCGGFGGPGRFVASLRRRGSPARRGTSRLRGLRGGSPGGTRVAKG